MRAKLIKIITMCSSCAEISYKKLNSYSDEKLQELADYVNLNSYERNRLSEE